MLNLIVPEVEGAWKQRFPGILKKQCFWSVNMQTRTFRKLCGMFWGPRKATNICHPGVLQYCCNIVQNYAILHIFLKRQISLSHFNPGSLTWKKVGDQLDVRVLSSLTWRDGAKIKSSSFFPCFWYFSPSALLVLLHPLCLSTLKAMMLH